MSYCTTLEGISPDMLSGFFIRWPNPPTSETHLRILQQAYRVVLAVDDQTNRVVGFVNAISDGVLSAYIPLLEVLPDYQMQGIGDELVQRMLKLLDNLYMIDLTCDRRLQKFYERFGLRPYTGMMIRNFDHQAGS
ncbi:MAG: GNAT family N-acetyltransferase [Candidatus Zixiibacteriota bacterium]|nr:MAG: GNAT family N-acetyltransferase [candidate division Zixibacteria bacterium]